MTDFGQSPAVGIAEIVDLPSEATREHVANQRVECTIDTVGMKDMKTVVEAVRIYPGPMARTGRRRS